MEFWERWYYLNAGEDVGCLPVLYSRNLCLICNGRYDDAINALLSEGVATVIPVPDSFVVKSDMVEDCGLFRVRCGSDGRRAQYYKLVFVFGISYGSRELLSGSN
jgi:hypothetical protein